MQSKIEQFVNGLRRRNPQARTWRDYSYDLKQFVQVVGVKPPAQVTIQDIDSFIIGLTQQKTHFPNSR